MVKLIVIVCALSGAHAGECVRKERPADSLTLCYMAVGIAEAKLRADPQPEATYEFICK